MRVNMMYNNAVLFWKNVKVPGWITFENVIFFEFFLEELNLHAINGDVLEIGAHFGKTSIWLDRLILVSDKLHICDVFEKQNLITDANNLNEVYDYYKIIPTRELFEQNFSRYGRNKPIIYQMESKFLEFELLNRSFKFIHIDGAHTFQAVNTDLNIALAKICENGIIVMDDYRNYGALGVAEVFWSIVFEKKLKLVLLTEDKAYFTFGNDNSYLENLEKFMKKNSIEYYKESISGEFFLRNKYKFKPKKYLLLKRVLPVSLYVFIRRIKNKCIKFLVSI
jgi:hypothetical protein